MAIKERKQITGTTEQINAYAGHEGQIVWDKDKKTFVGMSGTAGENYPLAQQAYVDNQFLPLTGGNLTGELMFNALASIQQQNIPEYEEILFQSYDRANQWTGGMLTCRGHRGSVEEERGSFLLGARNKDGSSNSYLLGTPAGSLLWQGNEVLRVTGAGDGWIRFYPNLQICYGYSITQAAGHVTANYPVPFNQIPSVNATIIGDANNAGAVFTCLVSSSNTFFNTTSLLNGALSGSVVFFWTAIGYY